jgi:hypothetical protein
LILRRLLVTKHIFEFSINSRENPYRIFAFSRYPRISRMPIIDFTTFYYLNTLIIFQTRKLPRHFDKKQKQSGFCLNAKTNL